MDIQINGENVILNVGIDTYSDTHAHFELL